MWRGKIDGAAEFGHDRLEALPLRILQALKARQHILVYLFGVRHETRGLGGTGFNQIDQGEADLQIGLYQFDANPMVR